jgi:hypothetical protein
MFNKIQNDVGICHAQEFANYCISQYYQHYHQHLQRDDSSCSQQVHSSNQLGRPTSFPPTSM